MTEKTEPFFVGYMSCLPKGLGWFVSLAMFGFVAGMIATSIFASAKIPDAGDGEILWSQGRQEFIGRLEYAPYPVLRVPAEGDQPARSIMLTGVSKVGVIERGQQLDGTMVRAEGFMVQRGDLSMLQVVGSQRGLGDAEDYSPPDYHPEAVTKHGRWKLTGEICDGKCYAGAMRPGRGLAHKACAALCLTDGVPPVFVSEGPIKGRSFFLMADKNGKLLGPEITQLLSLYISIEGEVLQMDDLMIFKADLDTAVVR
ncbi:MAG: hypothetical protein ABJK39_03235 [Hyphomicrobiales bacterium]